MKFYLCVISSFLLIFKTVHALQLDGEEIKTNIPYSLPSVGEKQNSNIIWVGGDDEKIHGIDWKLGVEVQQIPVNRPFSTFGLTPKGDHLFLLDCYNLNRSSFQSKTKYHPPKLWFLNTATWQQEGGDIVLNSSFPTDPRYELEGVHLTKDYLWIMIRRQQIEVYRINLISSQKYSYYELPRSLKISYLTPNNEYLIAFDEWTNDVRCFNALEGKEIIMKIPDVFTVPSTSEEKSIKMAGSFTVFPILIEKINEWAKKIAEDLNNLLGNNKKTLRLASLKAFKIHAGEDQGYISVKEPNSLLMIDNNKIKVKRKHVQKPDKGYAEVEKKLELKSGDYVVSVSKDGNHLLVKNENTNQLIYYKSGLLAEKIKLASSPNDFFFPLRDGVARLNPTFKTLSIFSSPFPVKEIKIEGKWENSKKIRYQSLKNALLIGEGKNLYIIHKNASKPFSLPLPFEINALCTFSEKEGETQRFQQMMWDIFQQDWLKDLKIDFK